MTIGSGGIQYGYVADAYINGGYLTSSEDFLRIRMSARVERSILQIQSVIADSYHRVGLNVVGGRPGQVIDVELAGNLSNTFTGEIVLDSGGLRLAKTAGSIAIRSNIRARKGSAIGVFRNEQIANGSTVTLSGSSIFYFVSAYESNLIESIHRLVVEDAGIVDFNATFVYPHYNRTLFLDDLEIGYGGKLILRRWVDGKDRFLVRRDSEHLRDSLWRIEFEGRPKKGIGYRDFNKDYIEIVPWATPEAEAYSATFSLIGLAFALWRRSTRRAR